MIEDFAPPLPLASARDSWRVLTTPTPRVRCKLVTDPCSESSEVRTLLLPLTRSRRVIFLGP